MSGHVKFEVGGRYRNRIGWYEVLEIMGNEIKVQYDNNEEVKKLSIELQARIIKNITFEEESVSPYENETKNRQYFKTLGYISNKGRIEADVPPKSATGFENNYHRIKGVKPKKSSGYYIHHNVDVDKWGVEMRLTFPIPNSIEIGELNFGGSVTAAKSPEPDMLRINNNAFCYKLLQLGFDLGSNHDVDAIINNIPERFKSNFKEGLLVE